MRASIPRPCHLAAAPATLAPPGTSAPPRARARRALALVLAVACALPAPLPVAAQVRLPALGESAHQDLSVADEKRIGESIMREGRRDPTYLDDPVLLDYIRSLWAPLVIAARQRGDIEPDTDRAFTFEIFLLNERSVNAFALPGGFVGVHLGLIGITNTRDQLASVLAHELVHVTQRHIARSIAPGQRASMVGLATMLLSILAATRGANPSAVNAGIAGGQALAIQGQLNFSRDMEREADRIGFNLLGAAGYSVVGMAQMFERMDLANRLNDNGSFPYLRSHPLTTDRMAEARSRTLVPGSPGDIAPPSPPYTHALMQARARVLMDTSPRGLARLAGGETSSPLAHDRAAASYAAGMATLLLRDDARMGRALQLLDATQRQLLAASPREPAAERALALLRSELLLARGDATGALQALAAAPVLTLPGTSSRPALLLRAQAALAWHRQSPQTAATLLRRSTEDLQTWVSDAPQDPAAWELLAQSAEALGLQLRALRAGAEARAAAGDIQGAIDRLRAAQASARTVQGQDFIEASVIDARLRQLVAERRQLVMEMQGGRGRQPGQTPPPEPAPAPPAEAPAPAPPASAPTGAPASPPAAPAPPPPVPAAAAPAAATALPR